MSFYYWFTIVTSNDGYNPIVEISRSIRHSFYTQARCSFISPTLFLPHPVWRALIGWWSVKVVCFTLVKLSSSWSIEAYLHQDSIFLMLQGDISTFGMFNKNRGVISSGQPFSNGVVARAKVFTGKQNASIHRVQAYSSQCSQLQPKWQSLSLVYQIWSRHLQLKHPSPQVPSQRCGDVQMRVLLSCWKVLIERTHRPSQP